MGFNERDTTETRDIITKPVQFRIERDTSVDPPVNFYVVFEVDGHADHRLVSREDTEAFWTPAVQTFLDNVIDSVS